MTQQIYIGTLHWHLLHVIRGPKTVTIGHLLRKGFNASLFPSNYDLIRGMRSVHRWPFILDFALTVERTDTESYISYLVIINSPTLRSSWTEVSSAQRQRPTFDKVFGLKCMTVFLWLSLTLQKLRPFWSADRSARGQVFGFAKVWEECSFPSQVWHAVKGPSL